MYIWDQIDLEEEEIRKNGGESYGKIGPKSPKVGALNFNRNGAKNATFESVTAQFRREFPMEEEEDALFGDIRSAISKQSVGNSLESNEPRRGVLNSARSDISSLGHDGDFDDCTDYSRQSAGHHKLYDRKYSDADDNLAVIAKQIEDKLTTMKEEYRRRDNAAKDLQLELQRLQTATERRRAKEAKGWEAQLQTARDEHAESLKKLKAFCEKLQTECTQLRDKHQSLIKSAQGYRTDASEGSSSSSSSSSSSGKRQLALEQARDVALTRLQQARRQLEQDERTALNKVAASRSEAMKRSIEQSVFAPRLEAQVSEGKRLVGQLREKTEVRLAELRRQLQADHSRQTDEQRQRQQKELAQVVERARQTGERRLEEQRAKHDRELGQAKDKERLLRESLQQSAELQRQADTEAHQEALRAIAKREATLTQELMEQHQKEVGDLLRENSAALEALRQRQRQTDSTRQQAVADRQRKINMQRRQKQREQALRTLQEETAAVLSKIRQEAADRRRDIRTRVEQQLQDDLTALQKKIDSLRETETSCRARVAGLEEEIGGLTQQTAAASERLKQLHRTGAGLRQQLAALREDLHAVEREVSSLEEDQAKELAAKQSDLTQQTTALLERERQLRERRLLQTKELHDRRTAVMEEEQAEISRIRGKIGALMAKKQGLLRELVHSLNDVMAQNSELEQRLEQIRQSAT